MNTTTVYPKSVSLAVTMLCNSRCIMCDIWKNRGEKFISAEIYRKLPNDLQSIDITGWEAFLRPDMPELIRILRETAPRARILVITNGFLVDKIRKQLPEIVSVDPDIAFRVSIDGVGGMHETIRRIPDAFEKARASLLAMQSAGVKNVGLIFTLMKQNQQHMRKVYALSKSMGIHFSLNIPHASPIYYGLHKDDFRPDMKQSKNDFRWLYFRQMMSPNPRDWVKAWFNYRSYEYALHAKRLLPCHAGEDFCYIDSRGNVYPCHIKNWPIGNLRTSSFEEIWKSNARTKALQKIAICQDCWLTCTTRDAVERHKGTVAKDMIALLASMSVR